MSEYKHRGGNVIGRLRKQPKFIPGDVVGYYEVLGYVGRKEYDGGSRHMYEVRKTCCGEKVIQRQDRIRKDRKRCDKCARAARRKESRSDYMTDQQAREVAKACGW